MTESTDELAARLTAEFLRKKHVAAFELAAKLAATGDRTEYGDLGRCFLELHAERGELREALADAIMAAEDEAVPGVIEVWVLKARELLKRTP